MIHARALRRIALYLLAGAAIVTVYPSLIRPLIKRDIDSQVTAGLASAVAITSGEIDTWAQVHRVQAATLARVAQLELDGEHGPPATVERAFSQRFGAVMDSLMQVGDFTAAWVLRDDKEILAATHGAGQPVVARRGVTVRRSANGKVFVTFVDGGATHEPSVAVQASLVADAFKRLNPTAYSSTQSTRTSVLMRVDDSLFVVVTGAGANASAIRMALPLSSAPVPFQRALEGTPSRGLATGSDGASVYYATGTVGSLELPIVREVDESEVLTQFRAPAQLQGLLVAGLLLSLAYLFQSRWNAAQLRRERELMRVRDDFVSSVSHELRTPLTQIRMYAELLRTGSMKGQSDTARALNVIEKEARRLAILVDNILNFSRLRRRTQETNGMVTDVAEETRHVIDAFGPLAAERGMSVRADMAESLRACVDSLALRQLLLNLLENAAKYGPRGQNVVIGAVADNNKVRIWVDDEGTGVPPDERSKIWEPFFRGVAGRGNDITGSGIGLSVVQDLVILHGGDVSVTDAPTGGARFMVWFLRA
ncbi:MAG: ATP-binding region ATPase domain protein [Gemmatimonadetes bacterium]|nr:ATP-binding region ATPase domain protein [Gemmatimonadota bacterium]